MWRDQTLRFAEMAETTSAAFFGRFLILLPVLLSASILTSLVLAVLAGDSGAVGVAHALNSNRADTPAIIFFMSELPKWVK